MLPSRTRIALYLINQRRIRVLDKSQSYFVQNDPALNNRPPINKRIGLITAQLCCETAPNLPTGQARRSSGAGAEAANRRPDQQN